MALNTLEDFEREIDRIRSAYEGYWRNPHLTRTLTRVGYNIDGYHGSMDSVLKDLDRKTKSDPWSDDDKIEGQKLLDKCREFDKRLRAKEEEYRKHLEMDKEERKSLITHALKKFEDTVRHGANELRVWCSRLGSSNVFAPGTIPKGSLPKLKDDFMEGSEEAVTDCEKRFDQNLKVSFAIGIRKRLEKFVKQMEPFVEAYQKAYQKLDAATKSKVKQEMEKTNRYYNDLFEMVSEMEGQSEKLNKMIRRQMKQNEMFANEVADLFCD